MAVKSKAAQAFVPIDDIYDGVVILKDGSMRMIVMASSINFALKSLEEQQAILLQFQSFLNSLEFSTQIYIQSRRLDIRPYLNLLNQRAKEDVSDLMRIQIEEYASFIKGFTDDVSIMTKNFFIVIPYSPSATPGLSDGTSSGEPKTKEQSKLERIEEGKNQLQQRTNIVKQGLVRVGIRVMPLGTEEIVELFYRIFNPSDTGKPIKLA